MSHYHSVYPSRVVKKSDNPTPLKRAAQEPALGMDKFLAENRNTGLLVMRGDTVLAERYQYERKPEHRFASMSMAKTVVGMLVGIALARRRSARSTTSPRNMSPTSRAIPTARRRSGTCSP